MYTANPAARPLKCKLCSRRFKYKACMKDHIKSDHKPQLLLHLVKKRVQTNRLRIFQQVLKNQQRLHEAEQAKKAEPVRISVIQKQGFSSPFSINNLLQLA